MSDLAKQTIRRYGDISSMYDFETLKERFQGRQLSDWIKLLTSLALHPDDLRFILHVRRLEESLKSKAIVSLYDEFALNDVAILTRQVKTVAMLISDEDYGILIEAMNTISYN